MAGEEKDKEILRSLSEVAKYLGVSTKTIERWRGDRNLPIRRVGKEYITSKYLLNEWILGGKTPVQLSPDVKSVLDLFIMAGLRSYFEIDDEFGGIKVKEGVHIRVQDVLAAIKMKVEFKDKMTKPEDITLEAEAVENPFLQLRERAEEEVKEDETI